MFIKSLSEIYAIIIIKINVFVAQNSFVTFILLFYYLAFRIALLLIMHLLFMIIFFMTIHSL
jgi:hypothetical protein